MQLTESLPGEMGLDCGMSSFLVAKFGESDSVSLLKEVEAAVRYVDEAQTEIDMNALYNYMSELKARNKWGKSQEG